MMNREELERRIVDASDGVLTSTEIENLEKELQNYPDLYDDYRAIMNLPDLSHLYLSDLKAERYRSSIQKIKQQIRESAFEPDSFEEITLNVFRRYALAASLVIFAVTSVYTFVQQQNEEVDSGDVAEEMFYPVDDTSLAESYVLYFENLSEE